jgi:hypothetical protein
MRLKQFDSLCSSRIQADAISELRSEPTASSPAAASRKDLT